MARPPVAFAKGPSPNRAGRRIWRNFLVACGLAVALGVLATAPYGVPGAQPMAARSQTSPSEDGDPGTSVDAAATEPGALAYTSWSEQESPNYVRLVGTAEVVEPLEPGKVVYEGLDALGRTGRVRACITRQMMDEGRARARSRSLPDPSGWPSHNEEASIELPDGRIYHGWFWNRSHLLAKSLGGSDELQNLVCGTRMQNVGANDGQGGMDMFESAIRSWLEAYPDVSVQYVATPLYEGYEPICRSVMVDVLSSDGQIDERLEVYNAAKGYRIDYHTGEFASVS